MKSIYRQIAIILGVIAVFFIGKHLLSEELVVESQPVAHMSFDEKITSIPFETITFGMGWFWGPDSQFGSLHGVLRTRVGYCGGDKEKPTYYSMGDHTEAISIDYDPEKISYSELLNYFWRGHRCERNNSSIQYENAIFYRDAEQKKLAESSLKAWAERSKLSIAEVATKIRPVKEFTYAEKYHQKYAISGGIRSAVDDLFPDAKSLADSTVATRLNAYLGYGIGQNPEAFLEELSEYGLSDDLEAKIRESLDLSR